MGKIKKVLPIFSSIYAGSRKCSKLTLYISIKLMLWWMCCRESLFWRSSVTVEKVTIITFSNYLFYEFQWNYPTKNLQSL